VSFATALDCARTRPTDPDVLAEVARTALAEGEEEAALAALAPAIAQRPTARLWQWKGLLERSIDEHADALDSLSAAAALDPADASIAHGLARVALEAGLPAEQLFANARVLAPKDGSVLLGLAGARLAAGRGEQAETELDAALRQSPLWIDGHVQLAQLRSMLGRADAATASLERALAELPHHAGLWQALFDLRLKSENFAALDEDVARARLHGVDAPLLRLYEAIAASEIGQMPRSTPQAGPGCRSGGSGICSDPAAQQTACRSSNGRLPGLERPPPGPTRP
jgi:tetratricopeptide (TPR) repeat protein